MNVHEEVGNSERSETTLSEPAKPPLKDNKQKHGIGLGFIAGLLIVLAVIGWFVYKGITGRVTAEKALVTETRQAALLTVSVVHPKLNSEAHQLVLPGNTQPLIDAPIYARTSGYLKKWYADIGTKVRAG